MKARRSKPAWAIHEGDCLTALRTLPDQSVHCVVTSPPYYQLRSYLEEGAAGKELEHGSEETIEHWLASQMAVFDEVLRVLRDDGLCWVNLGDKWVDGQAMGQPWLHCFAMKARGWRLVMDCIWSKNNPHPEPLIRNRPTLAHEYVFMFAKQAGYFYDRENAKVPQTGNTHGKGSRVAPPIESAGIGHERWAATTRQVDVGGANRRSVWRMNAGGAGREQHYAAFPDELPRICIAASTSDKGCCEVCGAQVERVLELTEKGRASRGSWHDLATKAELDPVRGQRNTGLKTPDGALWRTVGWRRTCGHKGAGLVPATVLDPYAGRGTTGLVALSLGRSFVGIELDPKSVRLCKKNLAAGSSLSGRVTEQDLQARQEAGQMTELEAMLWGTKT